MEGETVQVEVLDLAEGGQGVARVEGQVLFLDGGVPGDRVEARITEKKPRYLRGRVLRVLEPSPDRTAPPCPIFGTCGGCSLQALAYPAQVRWKERRLQETLRRIGGLEVVPEPTRFGSPFGYRTKTALPATEAGGRLRFGFFARGSHRVVVPEGGCPIADPLHHDALRAVEEEVNRLGYSAYDERYHRGLIRHVVLRSSRSSGQLMILLVGTAPHLPEAGVLVARLRQRLSALSGLFYSPNPDRTNVILGKRAERLWGSPWMEETLLGLTFRISPASFFQVNPAMAEVLFGRAREMLELTGQERLLDAYAGTGVVALLLARHAARVDGVEEVAPAVEDARANARANQIQSAFFHTARVEEWLPQATAEGRQFDAVVVDPPRSGLHPAAREALAASGAGRLLYISCNPATLARDGALLAERGYRLQKVQGVDLFPQTDHLETLALFVREEGAP